VTIATTKQEETRQTFFANTVGKPILNDILSPSGNANKYEKDDEIIEKALEIFYHCSRLCKSRSAFVGVAKFSSF